MELCDLEAPPPICWDEIFDIGKREWTKKVLKYMLSGLQFTTCAALEIYI
jgi:hypothetical protein